MAKPKKGGTRKGGRPVTVVDGEKVTVRLDGATLKKVAKVLERARFGTMAQVLREALALGLDQILREQEHR